MWLSIVDLTVSKFEVSKSFVISRTVYTLTWMKVLVVQKENRFSSSSISSLSAHLSQLEKKQITQELLNSTLEQVTDILNSKMADQTLVESLFQA